VQVQDAGGNPVLVGTGSITLVSSVTGTLAGTATRTPFLGTATYSNLSITKAGTGYTLTALSSSGVASATSDPFDVAQGATTIGITTRSPGMSVPGQNVNVAYDINVTAPAAGSLTGSVTVSDGTTSCTGGVTAGGGTGNCNMSFPSAGTRPLTATYSGDANFLGSASAPVDYTVNKAGTSLSITQDTPDPSPLGTAVTVHWNLTSSGSVPMTGDVTLSASATETCSAPAALGVGSCDLTFTQAGGRTITASYPGDANYNAASNAQASHGVQAPNVPPTAVDDPTVAGDPSYTTLEDATLNVNSGNGVLKNDSDTDGPQALTARNASTPAHGSVTLNGNGSFMYTPDADYNGTDSFTYEAFDGAAASTATVTVTITAVNDAPSFTKGPDQTASRAAPQSVSGWATAISAGPADESSQTVSFIVSTNDDLQFLVTPQVDGTGTLTYTPDPAASGGPVTVTIHAQDNGGTANGGVDVSPDQTFTITLTP
jgi:VCBS repeat-containing protein